MDVQIKRGLLDFCVLSATRYHESYGYKIIKDLKPYIEISESTLYPILRRLEGAKLISVRSAEYNGRLRKYYAITLSGIKHLEEFEKEWKEIMSVYKFIVRKGDRND